MSERQLPARPNLEQYKKQAKELARDCTQAVPTALMRMKRHHPRFHRMDETTLGSAHAGLTDAQLVIAREHGFESWPKFARHIEMLNLIVSVASLKDPVAAFIEVACVPRHTGHGSGTLEHAEMILARYPQVAGSNIHTAAILGDEERVRGFLAHDAGSATAKGGPYGWDALTHLCFSRYLQLDKTRWNAFLNIAQALIEAGADANTGWYETIDYPTPRPTWESAIYGAACLAGHPELTRLLLEHGADPNDEETPYHMPEGPNPVMKILLDSGKLSPDSLALMLLRKGDVHDEKGLRMILEHDADPNRLTKFGYNGLHQALRRDNGLAQIEAFLEYGADPMIRSTRDGRSAIEMATHRGRGDVLALLEQRGIGLHLHGADQLIAACAKGDHEAAKQLAAQQPDLVQEVIARDGTLLAEFASNGNAEGLRCLLDLAPGMNAGALYAGDPYFDIAKQSTALHVAAWRAWPAAVKELIRRGAPVNALDGKTRTALALAVKACVDSYWTDRRSPDSVEALLKAGATIAEIGIPSGYDEVDRLLAEHAARKG